MAVALLSRLLIRILFTLKQSCKHLVQYAQGNLSLFKLLICWLSFPLLQGRLNHPRVEVLELGSLEYLVV